jgi:hypothetical protein
MLSSITPLGQRGRGMSWKRTVIAFWMGSALAGAVVFGTAGFLGNQFGLDGAGPWVPVLAIIAAAILDSAKVHVPGPRRQVDEDWLGRYRDWIVGFGYGTQLGAGFVTIVPSFGTWALFLVASTSGVWLAATMGTAFGVGRSILLLRTRSVGSPSHLAETMRHFAREEVWARRASLAAYAGVIVMVGAHVA